jgi:hypothetical protein
MISLHADRESAGPPGSSKKGTTIGAKRVDQLKQNLSAVDLQLSEDEMQKLDEASALPPEYPGWMIPFQNRNRLADVPRF